MYTYRSNVFAFRPSIPSNRKIRVSTKSSSTSIPGRHTPTGCLDLKIVPSSAPSPCFSFTTNPPTGVFKLPSLKPIPYFEVLTGHDLTKRPPSHKDSRWLLIDTSILGCASCIILENAYSCRPLVPFQPDTTQIHQP